MEAGPGPAGRSPSPWAASELGHLHGDRVFHAGFPQKVWHELYDQGRIDYHPVFPGKPGYASRAIENAEDVEDVIALCGSITTAPWRTMVCRHEHPMTWSAVDA